MNLIITCARHLETETSDEIGKILDSLGDAEPDISITDMSGILTVQTKLDPFAVIKKIHKQLLDEPWYVRYCLRLIPIQDTVDTEINSIGKSIECIRSKILKEDSYRISIEKRNSDISSQELISNIASSIPNKVALDNPDKIILIEILGGRTGVAVIQEGDILSVEKAKRSLSE